MDDIRRKIVLVFKKFVVREETAIKIMKYNVMLEIL